MKQIFIVDDDIHIGNMLQEVLTKEGYGVSRAYSGTEAVLFLSQNRPDLILLDLMLPGLSGEDVLAHTLGIPVIVVSAKAEVQDKVSLLLDGAVDYVTKPFHIQELLARIQVHLRTSSVSETHQLTFEDLMLDTNTRCVTAADTEVRLTPTEYAILKTLMENPTQVITKSILLDRLSEQTPDGTENSLKMHISNLRKKRFFTFLCETTGISKGGLQQWNMFYKPMSCAKNTEILPHSMILPCTFPKVPSMDLLEKTELERPRSSVCCADCSSPHPGNFPSTEHYTHSHKSKMYENASVLW